MSGDNRVVPTSGMAPTWVGPTHRRRLNAYITLSGYLHNVARSWLLSPDRDKRVEYGDSALMRDIIRGAILGDGFRINISGTEWDAPLEPSENDDDELREHYDEELKAWQAAVRQQHWLERWAEIELLDQKIIEVENKATGFGDGVMVLSWSNKRGRVRVKTYDPGFFFPVYTDEEDDFPERVHIAWEFDETNDAGDVIRYVRRKTWELIDNPDGEVEYPYPSTSTMLELEDEDSVHAQAGHSATHTSIDPKETSRSDQVCVMSEGVWRVADFESGHHVDDLLESDAVWQENADGELLYQFPLGIDFIPVIHIPNTINLEEHYGESVLLRVAHILDDLIAADSDLAAASAIVGTPPLMVSGWEGQEQIDSYGPGQVFAVTEGSMEFLDTATALDALLKYIAALTERLAVNRQIPDAIFGRVDASEVPSGVSLLLSFGPFRQYIEELRLPRQAKYGLFVKFVQRLARVGGQLDAVHPGEATFGSYLPNDVTAVVDMVTRLISGDKPIMSKSTALRLLRDAGVEIEDIGIELDRVRAEDFSGAQAIADATSDENAAREYLGMADDDEVVLDEDGAPVAPAIPDEDLPEPT
jgi:hypothetical protein